MLSLSCPLCDAKLKVNIQYAGKKVRCPKCQRPLDVPSVTVAFTAAPVRPSFEEEATAPPRDSQRTDDVPTSAALPADEPKDAIVAQSKLQIEAEIARGGMGAIMRAVDRDIRREVAVKFLLNQADPKQKARFFEEAQITGQLEHPNIVPIHQLGVGEDGRCFFSMKMVKGRSLADVLKDGKSEPGRLLTIFMGICNGMAYAHSRKVIHRDLKPANIMVGDFGEVYVMDWGLAKVLANDPASGERQHTDSACATALKASGDSRPPFATSIATTRTGVGDFTQAGAILGTPAYMPPEQARGEEVDEKADIYSLGAILYEMLTLTPPVGRGGDMLAILMRVVEGQIDFPEKRSPERMRAGFIAPELSAIAMKALSLRPEDRYPNVEALQRDVQLFVEGRSVSAKQDSAWEVVHKFAKRNKGLSAGLALALFVLLGSSLFLFSAWRQTSRAYSAFEKEQQEKEKRSREAIPAFLKAVRHAIEQKDFDDALAQTQVALDYDPDNIEFLLLKGQQLASRKDFAGAAKTLNRYLAFRPDDAQVAKLAKLCGGENNDDATVQEMIGNSLIAQKQLTLALGLLQANEQRLAIYRKQINASWPGAGVSLKFDKDHQLAFSDWHSFPDLTPLQGIPLSSLSVCCPQTADLSVLKGMPLTFLRLSNFRNLKDLGPLRGLPLTKVEFHGLMSLEDLGPLRGMALTDLLIHECYRIKDLTPLQGMPLTNLRVSRGNGLLEIDDLTSLRGMPLQHLTINNTKVKDIEVLRGMPLRTLDLRGNRMLKDFQPIQGMPLQELNVNGTDVSDIAWLQGMPLTKLDLGVAKIRDLTPLQGMNLEEIRVPSPVKPLVGLDVIRAMEGLERINGQDAAVFWKKFDAGEIK